MLHNLINSFIDFPNLISNCFHFRILQWFVQIDAQFKTSNKSLYIFSCIVDSVLKCSYSYCPRSNEIVNTAGILSCEILMKLMTNFIARVL